MKERRSFIKDTALAVAGLAVLKADTHSPQLKEIEDKETQRIKNPHLEKMPDHNLPDGFEREHIYAEINGKKTNIGSAFFFEAGKAQALFISNDEHPECFSPEINYRKVEEVLKKKSKELVIAFAGAYRSPSGDIEGRAFENGKSVGESEYSKWHGFVFITKDGKVELYRAKDVEGNFDKKLADTLVARAKFEQGSLFQQIPAIWNGEQKLNSSSPDLFKTRAICESKQGKKFVINCTEKVTQDEFLKMCLALKDANGNKAVWNLMLVDMGECSLGVFRDKTQIAKDKKGASFNGYTMVDEQVKQQGFTNVVVLASTA